MSERTAGRSVSGVSPALCRERISAPVFAGDTITAQLTVTRVREDKQIITLEGVAKNQRDEVVITGESVVLVEDLTP